jgi:hypothetical protein
VSPDFERLLREARDGLPGPENGVTEAARMNALAAIRQRRRPRIRRVALLAAALVVAAVLGVGVGTLIAPSGTAARGPVGLGFLPEPGWFALQSSARATATTPATAMASNVPFDPDDDVQGSAESSALPYATLLTLPPHGIVIAATFTPRAVQPWLDAIYPTTTLPLKLSDTVPENRFGSQVRPEEPLGHHSFRGAVNGHNLDLHVYFGTPDPPPSLRREAQRQLDRLVVRRIGADAAPRRGPSARSPSSNALLSSANAVTVDHTLLCTVRTHGGIHEVETRAHAGYRVGGRWAKLAYATITSGGAGGLLSGNQAVSPNALAWMTAGRPDVETTVDSDFWTFPVQVSGTIGYNRTRCTPARKSVPLTRVGLRGGATGPLGEERDCATPSRVHVRLRARLESRTSLRKRGDFVSTGVPILDAKMSVRTLAGKPILYAEVFQSGKAPLFSSRRCVRD